jgi:hypothetical protein
VAGQLIVLGLTHFGTLPKRRIKAGRPQSPLLWEREAIEVFASRHQAVSYRHWRREGITQADFRIDFARAFEEATAQATIIHFHLDGLDVRRAWTSGQHHCLDPRGSYTGWELVQTLTRIELNRKAVFWQNSQQVPLQRIQARTGAFP